MKLAKELSAQIRAARKEAGWSQDELAARLGAKRQWVSELETGDGNFTIKTLLRVAKALRLDVRISLVKRIGLAMLLLAAPAARAQAPRYLTLVEVTEPVAQRLAAAYNPRAERLWCVTSYVAHDAGAYDLLEVREVEPAATLTNEAHGMSVTRNECRDAAGRALPTIHTHSENNCQHSPEDVASFMARDAAFDGIQCGTRAKVWYFAWQLHAALGIPAVAKNAGGGK